MELNLKMYLRLKYNIIKCFYNSRADISSCIKELSRAAVALGYELDLSLTNARRHNEQSCERLTTCSNKARKHTEDAVTELRDYLYQCVYA